ncbi:hypothetical protein Pla175_05240 [Pirellulimonas nuda]|uniref:Cellulose-binding Sde182 nucleoside hydrolase-like domain-containing protein n=1 Tax=Pirellulimonas nuda TaxID=2528009 RepID=A0A518D6R2_9BACT|nr:nucleoside hydrolase-like domain-containing protein [Pirellulimonas nuda]QDU87168.1 hypothetical protein Pla175_05240 [Pirellulimonas nuda]
MLRATLLLLTLATVLPALADKPKVWIYTDTSDKTIPGGNSEGTLNDPDDISAMAGYLLMASEFDTLGIVVASTHRGEHRGTPDQSEWAERYFGGAYRHDLPALNREIGGYPENIRFQESCIKPTAERFDPKKDYRSLKDYDTVQALLDAVEGQSDAVNVLCWGSLTEPAIAVSHCLATDRRDLLGKMRFIAHWTDSPHHQGSPEKPEDVANCREDAAACRYMKQRAKAGDIVYHECGAIGQHGIVSGSPKGREYFDRFRTSRLGTVFVEGKYVHNCVDHSDAATYWTLLGGWGVNLNDIRPDGSNPPEVELANEAKFEGSSRRIHDELLRRSRAASAD